MDRDESKAKGGHARAESLTPEQRKEIARKAALARWDADVPQATHEGVFRIGENEISAAVLPNYKRLLTQATFLRALGRSRSPKAGTGVLATVDGIPFFLQAEVLKPFISEELLASTTPIFFLDKDGRRLVGYDAELLPAVAEVYLKFRDSCLQQEKKVPTQYKKSIAACDIIMRGLARVGIIALVDEATGYQYDRARLALEEILEQFIAKELAKWNKTFEDDFYLELFRLRGWTFTEEAIKRKLRPVLVGKLTRNLVYERLAPGVLAELERLNPKDDRGRRKHKLFQRLTEDVGHPRLREHLKAVTVLMRSFDGWDDFYRALNRSLPKQVQMPLFDQEPDAPEEESVSS